MFDDVFKAVLAHDGVVSLTSWADGNVHVVNTWNKYLRMADGDRLLIPAAGMRRTQGNIEVNPKVKLTLGSPEVMGHRFMGTGYLIDGTAKFLVSGPEYDLMKKEFPFLSRVLEVTVTSAKRTL